MIKLSVICPLCGTHKRKKSIAEFIPKLSAFAKKKYITVLLQIATGDPRKG